MFCELTLAQLARPILLDLQLHALHGLEPVIVPVAEFGDCSHDLGSLCSQPAQRVD
jgi:hypothetical protein